MHFSLVVVGAHDGSKMSDTIERSAVAAPVLLIEPVPFLFERLRQRYAGRPKIVLRNCAIALHDGEADFAAPKPTAVAVHSWGDQLGSLRLDHATSHDPRFADHFAKIRVPTLRFVTVLAAEGISSIDCLLTDTEGLDAQLIASFPFSKIMPRQIVFEFRHSDGLSTVGPRLAYLLILLDALGYRTRVLDVENMQAVRASD